MCCLYAGKSGAFSCQWLCLLAHWVDAHDAPLASLLIGCFSHRARPHSICSRRIGFLALWRCSSSCKMAARWERATFDVYRVNYGAVALSFGCKMLVAVFSRWPACQAAVRAAVRSSRYYGKVCRIFCVMWLMRIWQTCHIMTVFSADLFECGIRIVCMCSCIK